MKTFLIATPERFFSDNLFAILQSRYMGLDLQMANNNDEMAIMLKNNSYDLAIVNLDCEALVLSTEIMEAGLSVPILVYSETSHIPLIKKLYGAGISGVLNAYDDDKEILKAISDVLAKRIYISESVKQQLLFTAALAEEYVSEDDEAAFISQSFDFSHIQKNAAFTYLGNDIPVFTLCLN